MGFKPPCLYCRQAGRLQGVGRFSGPGVITLKWAGPEYSPNRMPLT